MIMIVFIFITFCPLRLLRPPSSTLFPYTTLFRSQVMRSSRPPRRHQWHLMGHHPRAQYPLWPQARDRKSTRLNSSHVAISYAVFCLKKKKEVNKHGIDQVAGVCTHATKQRWHSMS